MANQWAWKHARWFRWKSDEMKGHRSLLCFRGTAVVLSPYGELVRKRSDRERSVFR